MSRVTIKKWLLPATIAAALAALGATAPQWVPWLLDFAGVNVNKLEGLAGLVEIVSFLGAGAVMLWGWMSGRRGENAAVHLVEHRVEVTGSGVAAADGGKAAGSMLVDQSPGANVTHNRIEQQIVVVVGSEVYLQQLGLTSAAADLRAATDQYLQHVAER